MNALKKIDNRLEIYRNKDYDIADIAIVGFIGAIIGVLCMYPFIL
ncbi:unnamed protein product [marine sediment metagenome]|uniref:Uncharacterized protein n=1 Tax=marine sediment metagenome TaxID=412755 RepID=X1HTC4_9ZZZZ